MNSWQIALKEYNSNRDKYIIHKKGTVAYNAVNKYKKVSMEYLKKERV